jgi:DNA transformation protein
MPKRKVQSSPIRNIGPKSYAWLQGIGVNSLADVEREGAVRVYRRLKASYPRVTIVMLYALQGALLDLHWQDLPPDLKADLQEQANDILA